MNNDIIEEIGGIDNITTLLSLLNSSKYQRYVKWINARIRKLGGEEKPHITDNESLW